MSEELISQLEINYLLNKLTGSLLLGFFVGFSFVVWKNDSSKKNTLIHYPLIIQNFKNWTRKSIVELGRNSIRDPSTAKILNDPVIQPDGVSVENLDVAVDYYRNLTLRNYIQYIKGMYSKSQ
jgi:hypothetical protein